MLSQINSSFKDFSVREMVHLMFKDSIPTPQTNGEQRHMYLALDEAIESGGILGLKEVFSKLEGSGISYNSFQKRYLKLTKEFNKILNPYIEQHVQTPHLTNFIRAELIRFGHYLSTSVEFAEHQAIQSHISLYSDDEFLSLKAKNQALEYEKNTLKEDIQALQAQLDFLNDRSASIATQKNNEALFKELYSIHDAVKTQSKTLHQLAHPVDNCEIQSAIASVGEQISHIPSVQLIKDSFSMVMQQFDNARVKAMSAHDHKEQLIELQAHVDKRFLDIKSIVSQPADEPNLHQIVDEVKGQVDRLAIVNNSAQALVDIEHELKLVTIDKCNAMKLVESQQAQIASMTQTKPSDAYLTLNREVTNELSSMHELAKCQNKAIAVLTQENAEQNENHQMLFINIQKQMNVRLNKMETKIIDSVPYANLLTSIEDINSHVGQLISVSKEHQPSMEVQKSQEVISGQLVALSRDLKKLHTLSSTVPNLLANSTIDNDVLIDINKKINRLGAHHGTEVDVERLNNAFEHISKLVKDIIAQNQDFEARSIVPVENISHLVKSNEALTTKLEKVAEEKRDAVKQLSNMIKATSNSTMHKTSFTNTATVTELKSKLAKSEAQLMKSREEKSHLRRQVEAKDKKISKLSALA